VPRRVPALRSCDPPRRLSPGHPLLPVILLLQRSLVLRLLLRRPLFRLPLNLVLRLRLQGFQVEPDPQDPVPGRCIRQLPRHSGLRLQLRALQGQPPLRQWGKNFLRVRRRGLLKERAPEPGPHSTGRARLRARLVRARRLQDFRSGLVVGVLDKRR
jgi:hypothetical protein